MGRHASYDGCLHVQRGEYIKSRLLTDILVNTAGSDKSHNDEFNNFLRRQGLQRFKYLPLSQSFFSSSTSSTSWEVTTLFVTKNV